MISKSCGDLTLWQFLNVENVVEQRKADANQNHAQIAVLQARWKRNNPLL